MKILKTWLLMTIATTALTAASVTGIMFTMTGCGGGASSAPPVDLPAPIAGRIDVSTPDTNGNVTVTGSASAVDAGSMVLVVNETVTGTQAFKFLKFIESTAYAGDTTYPSVCSETGKACAVAGSDGSFVVVITASATDSIVIGVIDATTGSFTSELTRTTVPTTGTTSDSGDGSGGTSLCKGLGLSGAAVDIVVTSDGTPILLKQGSDTTTNALVIGASSPVTSYISGCYATAIASITSSGTTTLVVTSSTDKTIWTGTISGTTVSNSKYFTIDYEPLDVAFVGDATTAVGLLKTDSSVIIGKVMVTDKTVSATYTYPQNANGQITDLTQGPRVIMQAMNDGSYLGGALTLTSDNAHAYLTLFNATTMGHIYTTDLAAEGTKTIKDIAFWVNTNSGNKILVTALNAQAASSQAFDTYFWNVSSYESLNLGTTLSTSDSYSAGSTGYTYSLSHSPINIVVPSKNCQTPSAVVTDTNGDLAIINLSESIGIGGNEGTPVDLTAGHSLVAIDVNDSLHLLYAADATSGAIVDASSKVTWCN